MQKKQLTKSNTYLWQKLIKLEKEGNFFNLKRTFTKKFTTNVIFNDVCMLTHSVVSSSFMTPWTVAHQAPLSMDFPRQEYWSGLPFSTLGDLLDPGIEPMSHVSCIGRRILYHCATWEAHQQSTQIPDHCPLLDYILSSWRVIYTF